MVIRRFVLTLLGLAAILPARADGILEQMQTEVAAITERTRSAVVVVEDEQRKVVTWQAMPQVRAGETQSKRLQELQEQRAKLNAELAAQDQQVAELRKKYDAMRSKEALASLDKATAVRRSTDRRISSLQREIQALDQLARRQNLASLERSLMNDQIAQLAQRMAEMRDKLAEYRTRWAEVHPLVKKQKEAIKLTDDSIKELKERLLQTESAPAPEVQAFNVLRSNSGTGFCIGNGLVLTTADVVEPMQNPVIVTDQGTRIKAKIVGVNGELNVGLLQIQAQMPLPALTLGDSDPVKPGHFALSIGNQTGDPNSVALNLVGGKREQGTSAGKRFYPSLIQIAGTVGAGTSGAPLMNAKGEVIGIIVAVPVSDTGGVPLLRDLPHIGRLFRAPNAATPATAGQQTKFFFDEADKPEKAGEKGQRAAKKLLDGQPIPFGRPRFDINSKGNAAFEKAMESYVRTQMFAPREELSPALPAVASAGFAVPINDIKPIIEQLRTGQVTRGWIGIAPEDEEQIRDENGILNVTRRVRITGIFPDSPAQQAGVRPGDILIRINDKPVRGADDVRQTSLRLRPGDTLTLRIQRTDNVDSQQVVELKILPRPLDVKPAITKRN